MPSLKILHQPKSTVFRPHLRPVVSACQHFRCCPRSLDLPPRPCCLAGPAVIDFEAGTMNRAEAICRMRAVVRRQHKALSTEQTYLQWLQRYMAAVRQMPAGENVVYKTNCPTSREAYIHWGFEIALDT